jgi:hypothetical protein
MRRAIAVGVWVVLGLAPGLANARTPLPTMEVRESPRRLRLLDVRGPVRFGWGYSTAWKSPVYEVGFEAQVSLLELSDTTWMHLTLGESGQWTPLPARPGERPPSFLGLDGGFGLSRYASGGPAFVVGVTAGPRWDGRDRDFGVDGFGIAGRADVYPLYGSIPELVDDDRGWFRRYVLSGAHLWVMVRYDQMRAARGHTYAGGLGLDIGRTVLLPIVNRLDRR